MSVNGFVYVIESPNPADLLDGTTEGHALCSALRLARIQFWYSLVTSRETFHAALGDRLRQAWEQLKSFPMIHLSMHGNEHGIVLTDGTQISWDDLRAALHPLTQWMQGGLLVCMSTCHGYAGLQMAMVEGEDHTFWKLVGCMDKVSWAQSAVGYVTFYHLLFTGTKEVEDCVAVMNSAADTANRFQCISGAEIKNRWAAFLSRGQEEEAEQLLISATDAAQSAAGDAITEQQREENAAEGPPPAVPNELPSDRLEQPQKVAIARRSAAAAKPA
jgi:hypothetical protein